MGVNLHKVWSKVGEGTTSNVGILDDICFAYIYVKYFEVGSVFHAIPSKSETFFYH